MSDLPETLHISKTDDYKFALNIASKLDEKFGNTRVVYPLTRWQCNPDGSRNPHLPSGELLPYAIDDNIETEKMIKSYLTEILPPTYSYSVCIHDDPYYRTVNISLSNNITGIDLNLVTFVIPIEEDENGFTYIMYKGGHEYPSFIVVYELYDYADQWVDTTNLKKGAYN